MTVHVCALPGQSRCLITLGERWRCPDPTCLRLWMAVHVTNSAGLYLAQWAEVPA